MGFDDSFVLFLAPSLFFYVGVEMVVPTLAALFANSSWEVFCDISPIFGSMFDDKIIDKLVFLFGLK
jgi:hypothetical protein